MDSTFFTYDKIIIFFMMVIRITGMMLSAPIFSMPTIPAPARIALAMGIAFILFPFVNVTSHIPKDLWQFFYAGFFELCIGLMIGFVVSMLFAAVQLGGEYISYQMGLSIANVLDPITRSQIPAVGQFYFLMALLLFLFSNSHHFLIIALRNSFDNLPPGTVTLISTDILQRVIDISSHMFVVGLLVVGPVFAILFITEIAIAFVAKILPQMNIFIVGLPLKVLIGLLGISVTIPFTQQFLMTESQRYTETILTLFK